MPFLKLFHGRKLPEAAMEDWGEPGPNRPGPIFGPFPDFHTTYGCEITFDDAVLKIVGDVVYYDGLFYGDWSVFDGPPCEEDAHHLTAFDAAKAEVPEWFQRCECEQPGYLNCGVPGVIAHLENGRISPDAKVERCDQCQRYPDDAAARKKLVERGLVWEHDPHLERYMVHVYATVRVTFGEMQAASPQAAARAAEELFDWDQQRDRADFADEITEYLVDIAGDLGYARSRRLNADFEEIAG